MVQSYHTPFSQGARQIRAEMQVITLASEPYRELPSLAKNWVMRMLFLEQPLPQAAVALWVKKEFSK